jgi:hypothetical protein
MSRIDVKRNGGGLGGLGRKAFLIGLCLGGLLEPLFHWLEGGSEHRGGQLGNVPAISDSGLNPFLDQPLLQFDELRRAFHCGQRLHRSGQVLGILGGVVTSTWIGAARGLEGPLISGRGGGSPRPERFVS